MPHAAGCLVKYSGVHSHTISVRFGLALCILHSMQAMHSIQEVNDRLLTENKDLAFELHLQHFIELLRDSRGAGHMTAVTFARQELSRAATTAEQDSRLAVRFGPMSASMITSPRQCMWKSRSVMQSQCINACDEKAG
jgi:hypothetical protein